MPLDRGVIDQQLHALQGSAVWWEERELRDLPAVLHPAERILAIARGKIARVRWLRRSWLMVVTDERLVCLRSRRNGWSQIEVPADRITRLALRVGPFRGRVLVGAGPHTYRLLVPRTDAYKLLSTLSTLGPRPGAVDAGFAPVRAARRLMDHVLALPAAALTPYPGGPAPAPVAPDMSAVDRRFDALETELRELRQEVEFLEQLLRTRHDVADTTHASDTDDEPTPTRLP
jgi:hypothetical protein